MTDLGTKRLTYNDRIRIQGPMDVDLEYHADNAMHPHAVAVSVPPVPVTSPPDPDPVPVPPATGANLQGVDFTKRPRSGPAWDRLLAASKGLTQTSLKNTDGAGNGALMAAAYVAAATANTTIASKVIAIAANALGGGHDRTLEQARNLPPIALALSAIGHHGLDGALRRERDYQASSQGSIVQCHEIRPNNWGTCSGLARITIDLQIGDTADLAKAVDVFRGWLGDTARLARPFAFGDSQWQADPKHPVGINPLGATRTYGSTPYLVDGILPDDQRRQLEHGGGAAPAYQCENYVFQALGEVVGTAITLEAAGYSALSWSDAAVRRAYKSLAQHGCRAEGDDGWQVDAAAYLGITLPSDGGHKPGKSFGWVDWLYLA